METDNLALKPEYQNVLGELSEMIKRKFSNQGNLCSNHGILVKQGGNLQCQCTDQWEGANCDVLKSLNEHQIDFNTWLDGMMGDGGNNELTLPPSIRLSGKQCSTKTFDYGNHPSWLRKEIACKNMDDLYITKSYPISKSSKWRDRCWNLCMLWNTFNINNPEEPQCEAISSNITIRNYNCKLLSCSPNDSIDSLEIHDRPDNTVTVRTAWFEPNCLTAQFLGKLPKPQYSELPAPAQVEISPGCSATVSGANGQSRCLTSDKVLRRTTKIRRNSMAYTCGEICKANQYCNSFSFSKKSQNRVLCFGFSCDNHSFDFDVHKVATWKYAVLNPECKDSFGR